MLYLGNTFILQSNASSSFFFRFTVAVSDCVSVCVAFSACQLSIPVFAILSLQHIALFIDTEILCSYFHVSYARVPCGRWFVLMWRGVFIRIAFIVYQG